MPDRLSSSAFERNFEPIRDGLRPYLGAATGVILEIGSGSGQHVSHLAQAFPRLTWQPSEIDPANLASIAQQGALDGGCSSMLLSCGPAISYDAWHEEKCIAPHPDGTRPCRWPELAELASSIDERYPA